MRRSASGDAPRLSSDEAMAALRDLAAQGLDEEQISRALLDLTLQAAGPELADAVRLCALPAWFDAELLALLQDPTPPSGGGAGGGENCRQPHRPNRRVLLRPAPRGRAGRLHLPRGHPRAPAGLVAQAGKP